MFSIDTHWKLYDRNNGNYMNYVNYVKVRNQSLYVLVNKHVLQNTKEFLFKKKKKYFKKHILAGLSKTPYRPEPT